jgi:hypothetical protein
MKHLVVCLLLLPGAAQAAAWTQKQDSWQLIGGVIYSNADHSYDAHGRASWPELFQRMLLTTDTEYGWNDDLTVFVRSETAYVHLRDARTPATSAFDNAFEGGARYRAAGDLLADGDVLSVELSARQADAFNFAYSADAHAGGQDGGFRFLYGSGFEWRDRTGFFDVEAGYRFLSPPRPDQSVMDLTAGLWLDQDWMVMAQSFNLVSSAATAPYRFFRMHKLELSAVWRMTPGLSLQGGAFFCPMGVNALNERGLQLSLWAQF